MLAFKIMNTSEVARKENRKQQNNKPVYGRDKQAKGKKSLEKQVKRWDETVTHHMDGQVTGWDSWMNDERVQTEGSR
jgi:predicted site-specific integrase-resolvase